MARNYYFTPFQSNYNFEGLPTQQLAHLANVSTELVLDHKATTYVPPPNMYLAGEGFLHTGWAGQTWYYQPALELVTRGWSGDGSQMGPHQFTDHHFVPRLLRLNEAQTALNGVIDLAPTEPTISSIGSTFYRNATYAEGLDFSANGNYSDFDPATINTVEKRGTSTDGLGSAGDPSLGRIADCQGEFHGVVCIGNWVYPRVGLSNQVWGVNLVTLARQELLGFTGVSTAMAALELTTDPLDPPWGQSFGDLPFSQRLWNVLGKVGDQLLVQEETQTFTLNTISAFSEKNITKDILPLAWLNPPLPVSPVFVWAFPPFQGTGTWFDWWVKDRQSFNWPGIDTSAIDSTIDDIAYDTAPSGGSGFAFASHGSPKSGPSFPLKGRAPVYPSSGAPPLRNAEAPPLPEGNLFYRTLAELESQVTQMETDFNTAASVPVWRGWVQESSSHRHVLFDPDDLSTEKGTITPGMVAKESPTEGPIILGASQLEVVRGRESLLGEVEDEENPGFFKPAERVPGPGFVGGGEAVLETSGTGQFGWCITDESQGGRTQFALRSLDNGNAIQFGDPGGIYISAPGGTAPLADGSQGWDDGVLATATAPSPKGKPKGAVPLPHSGCKYVSDGDRIIFLTRDSTVFSHVNAAIEGSDALNEATTQLHKIYCYERPASGEGEWPLAWTFDTFAYMGGAIFGGTVLNQNSGDCRSNGVLTSGYVYAVLFGALGERLVKINAASGNLEGFVQLTAPGVSSAIVEPGLDLYRDNLLISNRAPLGLGLGEFWRLEIL